jgi:hypothetical protein
MITLEAQMRFARFVFIGAGIWGIVVLLPLYWLVDLSGQHYIPPMDYPQFFYGFLSVAMAWQIAFLVDWIVPGAVMAAHGSRRD